MSLVGAQADEWRGGNVASRSVFIGFDDGDAWPTPTAAAAVQVNEVVLVGTGIATQDRPRHDAGRSGTRDVALSDDARPAWLLSGKAKL
jgi:hypothetical protein